MSHIQSPESSAGSIAASESSESPSEAMWDISKTNWYHFSMTERFMETYLSILSISIALLSLWFSYRNRVDRIKDENHARFLEAGMKLSRAENLMIQAEANYREFWRLALTYASIKPRDHDSILKTMESTRSNLQITREALEQNRNNPKKVKEMLATSYQLQAAPESLASTLTEQLIHLQHEINLSSSFSDFERVEKLREAIAYMKQWREL